MRSETPEIAIELSLQPWRAFKPDGVIFFSDILTPLPALGIDFDVVKGTGPVISNPVRSMDDVKVLTPMDDPTAKLPFIGEILSSLRKEVDGQSTLLGFVGSPWTLAAYSVEGKADRHCLQTKKVMMNNPEILHGLLDHIADALIPYMCYQIESGAQVMQLFDSWAHHLSPEQFQEFSLPYAEKVMAGVRKVHPDVPLIFHANGGAGKLNEMSPCTSDVLGLDWNTSMSEARSLYGDKRVLQGHVDPMVLFGTEEAITKAVKDSISQAGGKHHILNVGHGVVQGTPEENVGLFIDLALKSAKVAA